MYCPKCGNKVADDARFCPGCGNELSQHARQPINEIPAKKNYVQNPVTAWESDRLSRPYKVICLLMLIVGAFAFIAQIAWATSEPAFGEGGGVGLLEWNTYLYNSEGLNGDLYAGGKILMIIAVGLETVAGVIGLRKSRFTTMICAFAVGAGIIGIICIASSMAYFDTEGLMGVVLPTIYIIYDLLRKKRAER